MNIHCLGSRWLCGLWLGLLVSSAPSLRSELLENLWALPDRISVGDPNLAAADGKEGPKGIATADFNGDRNPDLAVGNLDGTITLLLGLGGGQFARPRHILTGARELRSVLAADLNGDTLPDLAAASPEDGKLLLFFNQGNLTFSAKVPPLQGWVGVRNVVSGDFDGDGTADLAAAGPGLGVRHFRGLGHGEFKIMGDQRRLSPVYQNLSRTRPVYALRTLSSRDGRRDDLLVTHAESPSLWILSTVPVDRRLDPPVDPQKLPPWGANPSPVLITEVQVQNATTLRDRDGTTQPWVELLNKSQVPVVMIGWKLRFKNAEWTFPPVTIAPGRFLTVFLSGKNRWRDGEIHAALLLKENTDGVTLVQPGEVVANTIDLPSHTVLDVSRGLAPDADEVTWFDIPSPGAENNAGETNIADVSKEITTKLKITPRAPSPAQSVTVEVTTPENPTGTTHVQTVWFSTTPPPPGLVEVHHLMQPQSAGVYRLVLPPGAFTGTMPHRVLVGLRDGLGNDYTVELHPGLDEPEASIAVTPLPGALRPVASTPSPKVKSFEVGPIFSSAAAPGAEDDLIYADEESGLLQVHRAGPGARRFEPIPEPPLQVEGPPRDVKLLDANGDDWLDVLVVLPAMNVAVTYRNDHGTLAASASGELPTGTSPREAVVADFTGDGTMDAAVINRVSQDLSILPSAANAGSLVRSDQIYTVDGEVAGLIVKDFNRDGRDDVLQLHRSSSEISVRYARDDGGLNPPRFFLLGALGASALAAEDMNGDGFPDVITANLGSMQDGSITILLGSADGFGLPRVFAGAAALFAISVADFDRDGNMDVAAGLWDCRITFFRGDGKGDLSPSYELPLPFVNEPRFLVTKDFDGDNDLDIAAAGYDGDMVVLENRGAATAESWRRDRYLAPVPNVDYAANRIGLTDLDGDGDADLIIGTKRGVILYRGGPGVSFTRVLDSSVAGLNHDVSDLFTADIFGDDQVPELVAACRAAACLHILTRNQGKFVPYVQVDVPTTRYLAIGDLDGDTKPDLVGTGDMLWTVLSTRGSQLVPPEPRTNDRVQSSEVVINEVLPRNLGVPLAQDGGRKSDFIELFNGGATPVDLKGYELRVQATQEGSPFDKTWHLPTTKIEPGRHLLVICSDEVASPMHTGFTLPAEGGSITLSKGSLRKGGHTVVYPRSQENISWSRYRDGHPAFHANPIPSPGLSNVDNGTTAPEVRLTPPSPELIKDTELWQLLLTARGRDNLGVISMSVWWNRLDDPMPLPRRLILFDNGENGDLLAGDGLFTNGAPIILPTGGEIQFYLEAVDVSGEVLRLPDVAELSAPGDPPVAWSLAVGTPPTLEITEVSTDNVTLLRDETGGYPDYVKVRNTGNAPVDMSPIILAKSMLSDRSSVYAFPSGLQLPPGGEVTVFIDGDPSQGPLHAPFTLDATGDDVSLLKVMPSGARQWIDVLTVPAALPNTRFVRLPDSDFWTQVGAAVDFTNWSGQCWNSEGDAFAAVHFTAAAGVTYQIYGAKAGAPAKWSILETLVGDGRVHTTTRPLNETASLRVEVVVEVVTGAPVLRVDRVMATPNGALIYGNVSVGDFFTLFWGGTDGGADPFLWAHSKTFSAVGAFEVQADGSGLDTEVFYRLRGVNSVGIVWSAPGTSFRTLSTFAGSGSTWTLMAASYTSARIKVQTSAPVPANATLSLVAAATDEFDVLSKWPPRVFPFVASLARNEFTYDLKGLEPKREYFVRTVLTSAGRFTVSAERFRFTTIDPTTNLIQNLRLSEIMYHPEEPTEAEQAAGFEEDDFEFLELHNPSDEPMDLSGLWFSGIAFDFPQRGAPVIAPGGHLVIPSNPMAFAMRYGTEIPVAAWTLHPFRSSKLANSGEILTLRTADGTVLFNIEYLDVFADGDGHSLELSPSFPGGRPEVATDYVESRLDGGTPGRSRDQTFDAWRRFNFTAAQLANQSISGATADPDRDRLNNWAEYACGTNPSVPNGDVLTIEDGGIFANEFGHRKVLLTFPIDGGASEALFDIQWRPRFQFFWSTVISGFPDTAIRPFETSWKLSPDGRQTLYTVAIQLSPSNPDLFRLLIRHR